MGWADEVRRLRVRANAETPEDAETARRFGAEGIGLSRTEHMFFGPDRSVQASWNFWCRPVRRHRWRYIAPEFSGWFRALQRPSDSVSEHRGRFHRVPEGPALPSGES